MGDVEPAAAFLADELVEWQVQALGEGKESEVVADGACGDVGGLAFGVLGCGHTSHGCVERRAAVSAVDADGLAPRCAQGVEDVLDEQLEVGFCCRGGGVVDTSGGGRVAVGEFGNGEVGHCGDK